MTAMRSVILYFLACALMFGCSQRADDTAAREAQAAFEKALIERADRLELDTAYVPPPGDPMAHHTMGFARTLCSAVFVSGLDADFAAENVGYFTAPYEHRSAVVKREIDFHSKMVHLTMANGVVGEYRFLFT
jgi:hypothetical protein